MKRNVIALFGALVFVIVLLAVGTLASADSGLPDGVEGWYIPSGQWCQRIDGVFDDCYCPCEGEIEYVCESTPVPTDEPKPTKTEKPRDPTATPKPPTSTPQPEPTDKPKCNRGLGNGPEGCDPGNSGGKPGSAGEGNE